MFALPSEVNVCLTCLFWVKAIFVTACQEPWAKSTRGPVWLRDSWFTKWKKVPVLAAASGLHCIEKLLWPQLDSLNKILAFSNYHISHTFEPGKPLWTLDWLRLLTPCSLQLLSPATEGKLKRSKLGFLLPGIDRSHNLRSGILTAMLARLWGAFVEEADSLYVPGCCRSYEPVLPITSGD